jgi:uncharacterized pyridoxamine 5'-phosphate oxidase family protein
MPEESRAFQFIKKNTVAVVATTSSEGNPNAAMVNYVIDSIGNLYFITRKNSQKYKNLKKNPSVAVVIGSENTLECIQIEGKSMDINDEKFEKEIKSEFSIRAKLQDIYLSETNPFHQIKGVNFALFKIIPEWVRFVDYKEK